MKDILKDMKQSAQGDNGMEAVMIKNRLENLFIEERNDHSRYGLHASSILVPEGEFCYRAKVLSLFYRQDQGHSLPVKALKIFAQGNAMHEKWYNLFRSAGIDVAIERTLWLPEYDLSFTIDAIINILHKDYILDVKSQNQFQFAKAKGHPKGETQVNFYMWALSRYEKKKYRNAFVLVDNKNTSDIKVVPVEYSKEKNEPYIERLEKIQEMKQTFVNDHKAPSRICSNPDCKMAEKCVMRSACFNIGIGRQKLTAEEKKGPGNS